MEKRFSHWSTLTRVPAIDVTDREGLEEAVNLHGLPPDRYFVKNGLATGPGSGASLAAKTRAIKVAYESGADVALILEDDVGDDLMVHWRWSLDEIVEMANLKSPGWQFVQLQISTAVQASAVFDAWKLDSSTPFFPRWKFVNKATPWGAAAFLISRDGMRTVLSRLIQSDGKFDCLPEVKRLKHTGMRCHPDNFFWRLEDKSKLLLVIPPMFTTVVNEGSTGMRKQKHVDELQNDHDQSHSKSMLSALESSILAKAAQTFNEDFQAHDTDPSTAGLWYMKIENDLKNVLVGGDTLPQYPSYVTRNFLTSE